MRIESEEKAKKDIKRNRRAGILRIQLDRTGSSREGPNVAEFEKAK